MYLKRFTFMFFALIVIEAQCQNPFEQFGEKNGILTMTRGRFNEIHDVDSVVQIGSIYLDVRKKIIVGYAAEDTTEHIPSPTLISRWWVVDAFSEKYYNLSPYNFVANNPVLFIDVNGDSIALKETGQGGVAGFQDIVSQGSGGFYSADVDQNTGIVTMVSTGQEGQMTDEQQKFVNEMLTVTKASGIATINVGNNSEQVVIGNIATNSIDVGDMQKLGTDGKVTAQKALVHEARENYEVQVNGKSAINAHMIAGAAENRTGGATINPLGRVTQQSSNPNITTLSLPVIGPVDMKGTVRVTLFKNNVLFVTGNSRTPILKPSILR